MSTTDSIIAAESGGDPNAKNSRSSASGPGQFLDSTWVDTVRKHRPDLADQPDETLLALKTDPTLGKQMTDAYSADNQGILAKAGLPVTAGTTYLAHFAGPGGAVKVLQAQGDTPVADILGAAAVKANPFLQGMTAQGLQAWAAKKMGVAAPSAGVSTASAPPAAPAAPPPPSAPPIFAPQPAAAAPHPTMAAVDPQTPAASPIFVAPRKPIDLSALKAALAARSAPIFANQG
jgi:hypothetical protein